MITSFGWMILFMPLLHYLADFEAQWDWLAVNKSKRMDALLIHVFIYASIFAVAFGWRFGIITFITHFLVDYFTSRWARMKFPFVPDDEEPKLLWDLEGCQGRSRHRFFCVIGLDQMLHGYQLLMTAIYLQVSN